MAYIGVAAALLFSWYTFQRWGNDSAWTELECCIWVACATPKSVHLTAMANLLFYLLKMLCRHYSGCGLALMVPAYLAGTCVPRNLEHAMPEQPQRGDAATSTATWASVPPLAGAFDGGDAVAVASTLEPVEETKGAMEAEEVPVLQGMALAQEVVLAQEVLAVQEAPVMQEVLAVQEGQVVHNGSQPLGEVSTVLDDIASDAALPKINARDAGLRSRKGEGEDEDAAPFANWCEPLSTGDMLRMPSPKVFRESLRPSNGGESQVEEYGSRGGTDTRTSDEDMLVPEVTTKMARGECDGGVDDVKIKGSDANVVSSSDSRAVIWKWPQWCVECTSGVGGRSLLEVYVEDTEVPGKSRWVPAIPLDRVVDDKGRDAFLHAEFCWEGQYYTQDFGPTHVRRRGGRCSVMQILEMERAACRVQGAQSRSQSSVKDARPQANIATHDDPFFAHQPSMPAARFARSASPVF
eukprot:NODE_4044_length_1944_cov_5.801321.p1 GENE.NODE_4044_length_1944_cov_5.801321~~NODE_4044_length_1944_cov_5.801321.p1  ORF type:complete len:543 (-),score=91.26 NODE_4044_length_1944_cov_5.801321:315-1712(-)